MKHSCTRAGAGAGAGAVPHPVRAPAFCRVRLKKRKSAKATESITHCPQQYTVMNQCNKAASQRSNRTLFVQKSLVNTGIHYKASQTPQHGRYLQHLPSQMQAQTVHHLAIPTAPPAALHLSLLPTLQTFQAL